MVQNINGLLYCGYFIFFYSVHLLHSQSMLISISQAICQRLDNMEAKLQVLESTCRNLVEKVDIVARCNQGAIQVPMVAGSPFGATQTSDKVRW